MLISSSRASEYAMKSMQISRRSLLDEWRLGWISAVLLCALSPMNLMASPAASPSASPGSAPTPIAASDIVAVAQADARQLRQMQADGADSQTVQIASSLPEEITEIDSRIEETKRALSPGASLDAMRESEKPWQKIEDDLESWTNALNASGARLDSDLAGLPPLRAAWKSTLDLARGSTAPPEIIRRINTILDQIDSTRTSLQKSRAAILSLQSRVAEQSQRVQDALHSIKAAEAEAVGNLWMQDSPPIWSRQVWAEGGRNLLTNSQASLGAQIAGLKAYLDRQWTKLVYFALLLGALAVILGRTLPGVERRAAEWVREDATLAQAVRVFERPFAAASVLAFLCCRPLFPYAPRLFWAALAAVALVPVVILLRRLVGRHLFPVLNATIAFYAVAQVRTLVAGLPAVSRSILLIETMCGALFAVWFIRFTRGGSDSTVSDRTTRAAARLAAALFAFVFVANSLGYVALADYMGAGALASAYLAILLYAATNVIKGVFFLALQLWPLASLAVVQRHRRLFHRRAGRLISFAALLLWILGTLNAFDVRRLFFEKLSLILDAKMAVGSLDLSLGGLLAFSITIWLSIALSQFIRFVLEEDIYGRFRLAPGSSYAFSTILHYIILLTGFLIGLSALGADMTKLTILAGAFGVGIGFGLQNIFNNFFSGIILLLERPLRVGDVIDVGGATGVVMQIGIRASKMRLGDNSVLIVPNGQLISDKVTNRYAPGRQAPIELPVRVAYGSDARRVMDLILGIAQSVPLVSKDPAPEVFMKEFAADSLLFHLVCSTDDPGKAVRVQSDLAVAISDALREAGIGTPIPRLDR
jgi:small-conductance mechanosensitive channel